MLDEGVSLRHLGLWAILAVALAVVAALAWNAARPESPQAAPEVLGELPEFSLVDQHERPVDRATLAGRPWIADFIFTRCVVSCPRMTFAMRRLRAELPVDLGIRTVSISVDPAYDRPAVFRDYARKFEIASPDWLFLTGEPERVLALVRDGFKLTAELPAPGQPVNPDEPILHSTRFVLVDGAARIRGYYDAFDDEAQSRLLGDLERLLAESEAAAGG